MPGGAQFPTEEMRASLGTLDQDPVHLAFSNIVAGLTALREDGVSSRLGHPGDGPEIAARRRGWQDGIDRALGLIRKELGSLVDSPVVSSQTLVIIDKEA